MDRISPEKGDLLRLLGPLSHSAFVGREQCHPYCCVSRTSVKRKQDSVGVRHGASANPLWPTGNTPPFSASFSRFSPFPSRPAATHHHVTPAMPICWCWRRNSR